MEKNALDSHHRGHRYATRSHRRGDPAPVSARYHRLDQRDDDPPALFASWSNTSSGRACASRSPIVHAPYRQGRRTSRYLIISRMSPV
jgi:hypothetical protein